MVVKQRCSEIVRRFPESRTHQHRRQGNLGYTRTRPPCSRTVSRVTCSYQFNRLLFEANPPTLPTIFHSSSHTNSSLSGHDVFSKSWSELSCMWRCFPGKVMLLLVSAWTKKTQQSSWCVIISFLNCFKDCGIVIKLKSLSNPFIKSDAAPGHQHMEKSQDTSCCWQTRRRILRFLLIIDGNAGSWNKVITEGQQRQVCCDDCVLATPWEAPIWLFVLFFFIPCVSFLCSTLVNCGV